MAIDINGITVEEITYGDKEDLVNLPGVENKNKVTATDMNEIKDSVNNHASLFQSIITDISDLKYVPIKINSFSSNKSVAEMGSTVTSIVFSWTLNKSTIRTQKIDSNIISTGDRSFTLNQSINSNRSFTLTVTDERDSTVTASTSISFLNRVYYGVSTIPSSITGSFISKLTNKDLASSKSKTFSVNAGNSEYIWFAVPARFGECSFKVGGFAGGFDKISASGSYNISVQNNSGFTENYILYRSTNSNLGSTTVVVS